MSARPQKSTLGEMRERGMGAILPSLGRRGADVRPNFDGRRFVPMGRWP
jgi:hypothetical protein